MLLNYSPLSFFLSLLICAILAFVGHERESEERHACGFCKRGTNKQNTNLQRKVGTCSPLGGDTSCVFGGPTCDGGVILGGLFTS
jgi:hypothetical protein